MVKQRLSPDARPDNSPPWSDIPKAASTHVEVQVFNPEDLWRLDLVAARNIAERFVGALAWLIQLLPEVGVDLPGESRRRTLAAITAFLYRSYNLVAVGDWRTLRQVCLELASVRPCPAQVGNRCAPSMTAFLFDLHSQVTGILSRARVGQLFDATMTALPENLRNSGKDADLLACVIEWVSGPGRNGERAVIDAYTARWMGATWAAIGTKLLESAEFCEAVEDVATDGLVEAIGEKTELRKLYGQIRSEIQWEFALACRTRSLAGKRIGIHPRLNRQTREEAEQKARDYLWQNRSREGTNEPVSARELAVAVGISLGTVSKLAPWRALMTKREEASPRKPKAVAFTDKVEATQGESDAALDELLADHRRDFEPSPLDSEPRRSPIARKRV